MKKVYIMMSVIIVASVATGVALANIGGMFFDSEKHQVMIEKKAEMLGMDVEEMNERLENGETLRDIFKIEGMTKEDIMEKKSVWMEQWLNTMVENGKITQEQADEKLEKMQNGIKEWPGKHDKRDGHWDSRMGRGMTKAFHNK